MIARLILSVIPFQRGGGADATTNPEQFRAVRPLANDAIASPVVTQ